MIVSIKQQPLTKDYVLSRYHQKEIFELVFKREVNITDYYCSPLRPDSQPKCKFSWHNGKLRFMDHASGTFMDCFDLLGHYYGTDFKSVLSIIVNGSSLKPAGNIIVPTGPSRSSLYEKEIRANVLPFSEENYGWWSSFGIDYSLIKYENTATRLLKANEVYMNTTSKYFEKINYTTTAYIERVSGKKGLKIYSPNSSYLKWLSTLKRDDIFGWNELPLTGDYLFITSSYKDMLTLRSQLGYPVIAPQSEGYIPEEIVPELKARFKNIILFFDLDKAGIKNAEKYSAMYGFQKTFVPENRLGSTDPSDFCNQYSTGEFRDAVLRAGILPELRGWQASVNGGGLVSCPG